MTTTLHIVVALLACPLSAAAEAPVAPVVAVEAGAAVATATQVGIPATATQVGIPAAPEETRMPILVHSTANLNVVSFWSGRLS